MAGVFSNPEGGFSDCDSIEIGHGVVMSCLVLWENGSGVLVRRAETWVAGLRSRNCGTDGAELGGKPMHTNVGDSWV